jgi:hypothetical protein
LFVGGDAGDVAVAGDAGDVANLSGLERGDTSDVSNLVPYRREDAGKPSRLPKMATGRFTRAVFHPEADSNSASTRSLQPDHRTRTRGRWCAMATGLADHIWTCEEIAALPD